jgi:hypothetical protein
LNHDGVINSGAELFGDGTLLNTGRKATNGFEALQQYDFNLDSVINAQDSIFKDLQVWIDTNKDGVSAATELHTLMDMGVQSIHLNAVTGSTVDNGNVLSWLSNWVSSDGQTHAVADVSFTTAYLSTLENMALQAATKIDLTNQTSDTYAVRSADISASSNKTTLINGDATDRVTLDASWLQTGNQASLNGHTYAVWQNSTSYLMVDQQIQTHTVL